MDVKCLNKTGLTSRRSVWRTGVLTPCFLNSEDEANQDELHHFKIRCIKMPFDKTVAKKVICSAWMSLCEWSSRCDNCRYKRLLSTFLRKTKAKVVVSTHFWLV